MVENTAIIAKQPRNKESWVGSRHNYQTIYMLGKGNNLGLPPAIAQCVYNVVYMYMQWHITSCILYKDHCHKLWYHPEGSTRSHCSLLTLSHSCYCLSDSLLLYCRCWSRICILPQSLLIPVFFTQGLSLPWSLSIASSCHTLTDENITEELYSLPPNSSVYLPR